MAPKKRKILAAPSKSSAAAASAAAAAEGDAKSSAENTGAADEPSAAKKSKRTGATGGEGGGGGGGDGGGASAADSEVSPQTRTFVSGADLKAALDAGHDATGLLPDLNALITQYAVAPLTWLMGATELSADCRTAHFKGGAPAVTLNARFADVPAVLRVALTFPSTFISSAEHGLVWVWITDPRRSPPTLLVARGAEPNDGRASSAADLTLEWYDQWASWRNRVPTRAAGRTAVMEVGTDLATGLLTLTVDGVRVAKVKRAHLAERTLHVRAMIEREGGGSAMGDEWRHATVPLLD